MAKKTKKAVRNDEGKVVPEHCSCGGKIGVFIEGEPIYKCTACGKYYGTMPFPKKSLNESLNKENKNMAKKNISLNESQLRKVIRETIASMLSEWNDVSGTNDADDVNVDGVEMIVTHSDIPLIDRGVNVIFYLNDEGGIDFKYAKEQFACINQRHVPLEPGMISWLDTGIRNYIDEHADEIRRLISQKTGQTLNESQFRGIVFESIKKALSEYTNQNKMVAAVNDALFGDGKLPYGEWRHKSTPEEQKQVLLGYIAKCKPRTSGLNLYFLMVQLYEFLYDYEEAVTNAGGDTERLQALGVEQMADDLSEMSNHWEEGLVYVGKEEMLELLGRARDLLLKL